MMPGKQITTIAVIMLTLCTSCRQAPAKKKNARVEYFKKIEHFTILEELATEAMQQADTMSGETYLLNLRKTALPDWAECVNLFDEASQLELSPDLEENRQQLSAYSGHRIQQTLLLIKAAEEKTDRYDKSIDSIHRLIKEVVEKVRDTKQLEYKSDTSTLLPLRQL